MKCIEIRENKLVIAEREIPKPKKGEVLIKVHAAQGRLHNTYSARPPEITPL